MNLRNLPNFIFREQQVKKGAQGLLVSEVIQVHQGSQGLLEREKLENQ